MIYLGSYGTQVVTWPSGQTYPCPAPSFLVLHPTLPVLYAASESEGGALVTFHIGATEGHTVPTHGSSPCHVAVHPRGDLVAVANYGGGSVALFRLDDNGVPASPITRQFSGSGPNAERQEAPHAHFVHFEGDELLVVDLGTDRIHRLDLAGKPLGEITFPPGSGPRHFATGPAGRRFVAFELDGTIGSYQQEQDGSWRELTRVPASETGVANYPSHIATSPDGKYVYIANRGPNTIAVFSAAAMERIAEVEAQGEWPRHFAIDGEHLYVASQDSGNVARFRIDADGVPRPDGDLCQIDTPSCVLPADTDRRVW